MVTPAPNSMRPDDTPTCTRTGSVERTMVCTFGSASLTARMINVPPPKKCAARSLDSALAASVEPSIGFDIDAHALPSNPAELAKRLRIAANPAS